MVLKTLKITPEKFSFIKIFQTNVLISNLFPPEVKATALKSERLVSRNGIVKRLISQKA